MEEKVSKINNNLNESLNEKEFKEFVKSRIDFHLKEWYKVRNKTANNSFIVKANDYINAYQILREELYGEELK